MDALPDACAFPFDPGTMIIQLAEPGAMADFVSRLDLWSRELLTMLNEEELRRIALRRLQGFTLEEIAEELGCVPSTVNRKIERIRKIWSREIVP
jgi:DNA-directed RNA polymerase specialized sigma24 family protein